MNSIIKYFFCLVMLLYVIILSEAKPFMEEKKYLIAYYIPPEIETYVPITKDDIEIRSLHKIFIGNTEQLKQIKEIVDKLIEKMEMSNGMDYGITLKVVFFNIYEDEKVLFIDKNRNFEFKKTKGKIPKEYFDELINIFELCKEIVDLKYLQKIEKEKGYIKNLP